MSKGLFCPYDVNLEGVEWLVYSALSYATYNGPKKLTFPQIAEKSRCGTRFTASRAIDHLIELGLVVKTDEGYIVQNARSDVQNARSDVQNARSDVQNARFLKESNKENINNIFISESVSKDTHAHAHEVQDFDGSFYTPEAKPQSREEYNKYCLKLKCLVRTREYFWSWNDWKKWKRTEGDWRKALQWWMRNDELNLEKEQSRR